MEGHIPLSLEIFRVYQEIDRIIERLRFATGVCCPSGCGVCCESENVEATVLEVLPVAEEIYWRGEEVLVLSAIDEMKSEGMARCVLIEREASILAKGRCLYYEVRPLVCRLFGLSARRGKKGDLELCTCRVIREQDPAAIRRAQIGISEGLPVPVVQDIFMRIASMDPSKGFRRLPINRALEEALEYLWWKKPKRRRASA